MARGISIWNLTFLLSPINGSTSDLWLSNQKRRIALAISYFMSAFLTFMSYSLFSSNTNKIMSPKPTLGYWNQRGLGQQARLLLTYLSVDFVDKRYSRGEDGKGAEWFQGDKFKLGHAFPNLPYYIDGDVKLTQSLTIVRHIARKHNVDGTTEHEKDRILLEEQQVCDLMAAFYAIQIKPNYAQLKEDYLNNLEPQLILLESFLGNGKFVACDNISYADFWLYEYLIKVKVFAPEFCVKFERLGAFVDRIEQLQRITDYIKKQEPAIFSGPKYAWN